jgi:hypothetical protein
LGIHSYQPHDSNKWFVLTVSAADLWLDSNKLTGTVPTEINSLTILGEFVGHCLAPIIFLSLCPHECAFSWIVLCIADFLYLYDNMFTGNYTCPAFVEECGISCDNGLKPACRSLG